MPLMESIILNHVSKPNLSINQSISIILLYLVTSFVVSDPGGSAWIRVDFGLLIPVPGGR